MNIQLYNAWFLTVPIILVGIYIAVFYRDAAKRMADMTGYSRKEKVFTVSASMTPHLFTLLTVFIPLSANKISVAIGFLLYAIGLIGFIASVASYVRTPSETLAVHGIYKISRNPMYVAAFFAYAGIAAATLNVLLTILLGMMMLLHHKMIVSEESLCAKRFGKQYEKYRENTPRYLFV